MTSPAIGKYQLDAERVLLGILMARPHLAETCGVSQSDLSPECGHQEILGAILTLNETKGTADPVMVTQELIRCDQLTRVGNESHRAGVYVIELVEASKAPGSLEFYARMIREATARRNMYDIGSRLVQSATTTGDLEVVLDHAAQLHLDLGILLDSPLDGNAPIAGLSPMEQFVNEPSPAHTWVIPGICERADRVMIVADEGAGKSVMARQLCTLLAAGRHPFAPRQRIYPRRTLLIDLENPPDLVRRGLRDLVGKIHEDGLELGDRAWRWNRPGGIDLRSTADRQLLTRVIDQVRPDLIAIGPLYKASLPKPGDTYEIAAAETAKAIDWFRERFGCAFWIEHHAPKSSGPDGQRNGPIGSSFWLRWPEFGLVLKWAGNDEPNVYHLARFRGDRDQRFWPDKLLKRAGRYPWTPDWDDAEVQNNLFLACDEEQAEMLREARVAREAGSVVTPVSNGVDPVTQEGHQPTPGAPHGPGTGGSVSVGPHLARGGSGGSSGAPRTPPWQERYTPGDIEPADDDDDDATPDTTSPDNAEPDATWTDNGDPDTTWDGEDAPY